MFCPNCGTQNDENNAKCQKCGFSIKGALAPKFKGTMLMMNAPPAVAQRLPSPAAGTGSAAKPPPAPVAAPAPVPKKPLSKMTMIGVAPPSPGAVAPPGAKPESRTGTMMVQGSVPQVKPSVPPGQGAAAAPRPSAPPVARAGASRPPVNPFGGTMLMGAFADGSASAQASSGDKEPGAPAIAQPEGASPTPANPAVSSQDQVAALSTTTPSVAPPEPANPQKLPSEMATVASAVSPAVVPGLVAAARAPAPLVAQPEWETQAIDSATDPLAVARDSRTSSPGSLAIAPRQNGSSLVLRLVLGVITLGIYPLVLCLVRKRRSEP